MSDDNIIKIIKVGKIKYVSLARFIFQEIFSVTNQRVCFSAWMTEMSWGFLETSNIFELLNFRISLFDHIWKSSFVEL